MANLFLEVDGREVSVKANKIGKGAFATVYKPENLSVNGFDNPVLIISHDYDASKEVMKHLSGDKFFPVMEWYGRQLGTGYDIWVMEFYNKLTKAAATPEAWSAYRLIDKAWKKNLYSFNNLEHNAHIQNQAIVESLPEDSEIQDAVNSLYSWASSYGPDYLFEFNKGNMALDNNGNLILRDPVFSLKKLKEIRRK